MIKNVFKKSKKEGLTIIILDPRKNIIDTEVFSDLFDFFNYCYEHDIKKISLHCYDPKKRHILIVVEKDP